MKKFLASLLVVIIAVVGFVVCKKKNEIPPTNEELIIERVELFLTSYNDGDMDTVLSCLDAKTRNSFQAMLNLIGGIAGSLTGINIDLSDLFSLGVNTTSGDFMQLKISNINIIDNENATVTTTMNLAGAGWQIIYFIMVYENGGWYIHDMNDRKPADLKDNQDSI